MCVAFGILRLGLLTELLSKPIRIGYVNGIALTIFVGQLPEALRVLRRRRGRRRRAAIAFVDGPAEGLTNPTALCLGLGSIARHRRLPPLAADRSRAILIAAIGSDRR